MASRILLATACRWFSTARIAMAFRAAGCAVEMVCPPGHPALAVRELGAGYRYNGLAPHRSLERAMAAARPDLVVPCDDLAMRHLHTLHAAAAGRKRRPWLSGLIERSMGDPAGYAAIESRERFMGLAAEQGVPTPRSRTARSAADVDTWIGEHGLPAVLKAEGTWGGEGVRIVYTAEEAQAAYRTLSAPLAGAIVAKRAILDRDWNNLEPWVKQRARIVSIQSYIPGQDANIAVACWQGEVLASVTVEVLETWRPKGPATLVRRIENPEILASVRRILKRLKYSGLCGFDFLLEETTGRPVLIEMNARATQTCPFPAAVGDDPVASLCARLSGATPAHSPAKVAVDTVALFPLAWNGDLARERFRSAYQDIPREQPELVAIGMKLNRRLARSSWVARRLGRRTGPAGVTPVFGSENQVKNYDVLHLIGSNLVGGPEKQILHHAVDMLGSEYRIAIGSFHDLEEWPEILSAAEERGIPTVCFPGGLRLDLVQHVAAQLRERPATLLCTHGFKANVVGYLASKRTGMRHVAFLRGFTAENARVMLYEMVERQALKRAQRVVCVSEKQAEQIGRIRRHRPRPVVVKNAMLPPYSREQGREPVSRAAIGVPEQAFVFGSVGRLSIEKGHRFMMAAFHRLCQQAEEREELFLIVVGNGKEQEPLERQAAELGIGDQVYFAGFQGNPAEWMRLLDCLVQPSLTEGTPNAVLEALCLRVPVVATAVGGVPDLIQDGRNGLLVPAEDVAALAGAMERMAGSRELRERLAASAEETTAEYSPAHQRQRLIEVYRQAFA